MSRRTWRIDLAKDGLGADETMRRESGSRPSNDEMNNRTEPGIGPVATESEGSGLRRWRDLIMRMGRAAWARPFRNSRVRFEEALHRIVRELEKAGTPVAVEQALLRLAREVAPTSRIALIRPLEDDGGDRVSIGPVGEARPDGVIGPMQEWARRVDETVAEVPLGCGTGVHGQLRILTPGVASIGTAAGMLATTGDGLHHGRVRPGKPATGRRMGLARPRRRGRGRPFPPFRLSFHDRDLGCHVLERCAPLRPEPGQTAPRAGLAALSGNRPAGGDSNA